VEDHKTLRAAYMALMRAMMQSAAVVTDDCEFLLEIF
jgi:hypothetical protein